MIRAFMWARLESVARNMEYDLDIDASLRRKHWYVIGAPESGKTTFLKNIMIQDMERGEGLCFLDLHGDAAAEIVGNVPESRIDDVIYYDPFSPNAPQFNFLRLPYEADKIATDLTDLFEMFAKGSWGPRMSHLLKHALLTLIFDMRDNGTVRTLYDLKELMLNEDFRTDIIENVRRDRLRAFWDQDFSTMGQASVGAITNKLSEFLLPESTIERVFSEPENDLNFADLIEKKQILIVRLAKGKGKGEAASRVLGSVIVRGIQQAALARENIPEEQRTPFYCVVDEFQNFTSSPFESILSETRKFKIYLTLSHQLLSQVPTALKDHIIGIAKVWVVFSVSYNDAKQLQPNMHKKMLKYRYKGDFLYASYSELIEKQIRALENRKSSTPYFSEEQRRYSALIQELNDHDINTPLPRRLMLGNDAEHIELRYEDYPTADDITDLPQFDAFIKIDTRSNVYLFTTEPAPRPDPEIKEEILAWQNKKLSRARAVQRQQIPSAILSGNSRQPTDDDFSY